MKMEKIVLNEERNVELTAYIQNVGGEFNNITKRPAVLVLPGGGYKFCSAREAELIALEYLKEGYQAFVLKYSVGKNATWPNPLNDYEKAMQLIRDRAQEWNIYEDKIAVVGFSAGGHLAACAATMAQNRPNAAILGYPVINGKTVRTCEKTAPDVLQSVDENTCPCFVFATRTDGVVPVENTIQFISALEKNAVSFETHIYGCGPHGLSTAGDSVLKPGTVVCSRVPHWVKDSIEWLRDMFGTFGNGTMTDPLCQPRINADEREYLSLDCTLKRLLCNRKSRHVIEMVVAQIAEDNEKNSHMVFNMEQLENMLPRVAFRQAPIFENMSEIRINEIERQLNQIKND